MLSWTGSKRCVVCREHFSQLLDLRIHDTPARLDALFKSSQSSPFVSSRIRGSCFLASDCVLNVSKTFSCRDLKCCSSKVPRGSSCSTQLYRSCATWQVWFSSFLVPMRSVIHSNFVRPRNSRPCTWNGMEWNGMDSHGCLEVTIRQTESKKNYPTTS